VAAGSACVLAAGFVLFPGPIGAAVGGLCAVAFWVVAARSGSRRAVATFALARALDLAAAALSAGQRVADAIRLAAPLAGAPFAGELTAVADALDRGDDPEAAWARVTPDGPLSAAARTAIRASTGGVRLAPALREAASEIRDELRAGEVRRAERAGVLASAPLAFCFLPAFACLGIVPTVAGLFRGFGVPP
jgi:Flp pilus assembly protein TadB